MINFIIHIYAFVVAAMILDPLPSSPQPEVVGSLCSLKELWFDGNRVRSVAPFIGQLSQLTYLDGSNNRVDSLPDELANCKMLTDLHLSINHLKVSCCADLNRGRWW